MKVKETPQRPGWTDRVLRARPYANAAMEKVRQVDGSLRVSVPLHRPRWMVPPLSWMLPFSEMRVVELDALGSSVLEMCDGRRTVERMIENFASEHRLSFREAQTPVMEYLRQLTERGLVAIVGANEDGNV